MPRLLRPVVVVLLGAVMLAGLPTGTSAGAGAAVAEAAPAAKKPKPLTARQRTAERRRAARKKARLRQARRRQALRQKARPAQAPHAPLRTSGTAIVDRAGRPVLLRGFNVLPVWPDAPGRTWSASHYAAIAAAGFNTVRLTMHWDALEPRRGELDQRHLASLDEAIAGARAAGLYVVLNPIHIYLGNRHVPAWAREGDDPLRAIEQHALPLVRTLAARYRDEPALAAYDPINEPPSYPPDQRRIMRMYDALIAGIRSVDADRIVMLEPSYGDSRIQAADLREVRDRRNVVFSLHDYYGGGSGDGYRPNGEQDNQFNGQGSYTWDDRTGYTGDARALDQHLRHALDATRTVRMPLWIGEFGVNPDAPRADQWIRDKVALFKRHGLGYAWWLYGQGGGMQVLGPDGAFRPFVARLR